MAGWRSLLHGLRVLARRRAADRDLDDELAHFMDEAAAEAEARGLSKDDAARAVRRPASDAVRVREQVRDGGWERTVSTWLADIRLAWRMLRRSPVFTIVVISVVALGSGAVTTVFSAMNAMVLRPIPGVPDPDRLVSVLHVRADRSVGEQINYPLYEHLRDHNHTLEAAAVWGRVSLTLSTGGPGVAVQGHMVSDGYFATLGVSPLLGRFFLPEEVRTPGASPVLVISERFWREHLAALPEAVGRTVFVSGHPFAVVGVVPDGFHGIYTGLVADAWVPVTMQPQLRPRSSLTGSSWTWMFARLATGVDIKEAEADLSTLVAARASERGSPDRVNAQAAARLVPLTGLPGGERRGMLGFMSLLLGAAALVLLIAGVNVASMLSARYLARMREMAVRAALGAGRGRLVRHLLTEIVMLFTFGAVGGYAVAGVATTALERLPLPEHVPVTLELSPDLRVFAFAVLVSLATGLAFGLAPALSAAKRDITARLRDQSAGSTARHGLASRTLVAGQLACSLVLLLTAALFLRALAAGERVEVGFNRDGVAMAWLEPEAWGYDEARARRFLEQLEARISALPGTLRVSATGRVPLMMGSSIDRMVADNGVEIDGHYASVGPEYFSVLELPLVAGRSFSHADAAGSAPVAIVNEAMAARLWPGGGALGRTFRFRDVLRTVVGVARSAKYALLDEELPAFAYFPIVQVWHPTQALLVRTAPGVDLSSALQGTALAIDARIPPPRVTTLARATAISLLPQRAAVVVTAVLGVVGLALTVVGVYGVIAFSAGRRSREIGIRVALGATRSAVLSMIVGEGVRLSAVGVALGLALALAATRLLSPWLFGVDPLDPSMFAAAAVALWSAALLASYIPARRAASADPLESLRVE